MNRMRTPGYLTYDLITDHYHYFEWNGMGYHADFDTREFIRGQEGDPWRPRVKEPDISVYRGKKHLQLEVSDPLEPFICPKKYLDMYNDTWDHRYHFDWSDYASVDPEHE